MRSKCMVAKNENSKDSYILYAQSSGIKSLALELKTYSFSGLTP